MFKPFVFVCLLVVMLFFVLLIRDQPIDLNILQAHVSTLLEWRQSNPFLLFALIFLAYVLVTALSLPLAIWMTLGVGALFGFSPGLLLVSFASSIGATLAFLAARYLLRGWVRGGLSARALVIDEGLARDGAFYLFTLRLIPVLPFFAVNFLMGLTTMHSWTFFGVSQIGMLAGTAVYVNAGTQLAAVNSLTSIFSTSLLLSFALLGLFPLVARRLINLIKRRTVYAGYKKPTAFDRNLVVIGRGAAGLISAYIGAATKAKVTLIEAHKMGGIA
ncbi:MAG: VTT domain-containing protein [Paracoccaceae bacterium]|nr:VTT domain-containing protein [Paracoccaceae bacterium]